LEIFYLMRQQRFGNELFRTILKLFRNADMGLQKKEAWNLFSKFLQLGSLEV